MDKPIERTVIWDNGNVCWRDKVTGVNVTSMGRPLFTIPGAGFYQLEPEVPSQSNDDEGRLRSIARDEATHVLANAVIPQFPAYFVQSNWLVTYEWAKYLADLAEQRAVDRIKRSFPRWLRWLIR